MPGRRPAEVCLHRQLGKVFTADLPSDVPDGARAGSERDGWEEGSGVGDYEEGDGREEGG